MLKRLHPDRDFFEGNIEHVRKAVGNMGYPIGKVSVLEYAQSFS
jgi:hypothetical protein